MEVATVGWGETVHSWPVGVGALVRVQALSTCAMHALNSVNVLF